jgi:hypothetical protein
MTVPSRSTRQHQPRVEEAGLREADRAASTSCPERACDGGLQKEASLLSGKGRGSLPEAPVEIWFQDEARVGQKNKITRRWAKARDKALAPKDQRTKSAYIFGAICPELGKAPGSSYPSAIPKPWPCTSPKYPCHRAGRPCRCPDGRPDGTRPASSGGARQHQHHPVRPSAPSSTRSRTSGCSFATTGCRTGSSHHTKTSSTTAARLGTSSSISHGASTIGRRKWARGS